MIFCLDGTCAPETLVSVASDDDLGDILKELNSSASATTPPTFTRTKPLPRRGGNPLKPPTPEAKVTSADEVDHSAMFWDWTEEDDQYFTSLGVSTETAGKISSCKSSTSNDLCEQNCDTIKQVDKKNIPSNVIYIKSKPKKKSLDTSKTRLKPTVNEDEMADIEHFLTPSKDIKRSRSDNVEIQIEEYASQQLPVPKPTQHAPDLLTNPSPDVQNTAPVSEYGRYTVTKVTKDW